MLCLFRADEKINMTIIIFMPAQIINMTQCNRETHVLTWFNIWQLKYSEFLHKKTL